MSTPPSSTLNRRSLITSGVATAAVAAAPAVHGGNEETIRVGLIGCGGRGSGAAINAMQADPRVRIVGLADLFSDSMDRCREGLSRQYPEQFVATPEASFDGFDGYQKLLEMDIDAVLMCSPPHFRPDHFEAAVQAEKQIFCEKPIATDPAGVRRGAHVSDYTASGLSRSANCLRNLLTFGVITNVQ